MATSGTEAARAVSTVVPATGTVLVSSDQPALYLGDGVMPASELRRVGEWPSPAGPLANIKKSTDGVFKVMLLGTSKQTFDSSACQVFAQQLKNLYGSTDTYHFRAGVAGGSFTSNYLGWAHQRYGGPFQFRLAGTSTSTPISLTFYGDYATVEFSRETTSEACNITIDGSVVGQTPGAGAQAYSLAQTFTLTEGLHTLTIAVPTGGGSVFFEHMTGGLTSARGVDVRDATLGGSLFSNHITVAAAVTGQAASIPIVGDNGINATFNRPDVDLMVMGYLVNDAGWQPTNLVNWNSYWKTGMDKVAAITAANGTKLILIVETAGHYIMPNDNGGPWNHRQYLLMADYYRLLAKRWPHITVVDHQGAIQPPSYSQADLQAYATMYFPNAGTINVAAGSYSGTDFIHELPSSPTATSSYLANQIGTNLICKAAGIPAPARPVASYVAADRVRQILPRYRDYLATIAGVTKRYATVNGGTWQARAATTQGGGYSSGFIGAPVPYVRDANPTNIAASAQTAIDASAAVDPVYGPYLAMTQYGVPLSTVIAVGARRMLTIRARGNITVRAQGGAVFYSSYTGAQMPYTDVANSRTDLTYILTGTEPAAFSAVVGATATGGFLYITGDVFEVALVDADTPTLVKNAPPVLQGPKGDTGTTGAAGGLGSPLFTGSWSLPTVYGTATTVALTAGQAWAIPFLTLDSGTIDAIGIEVSTAVAGALVRLGLYSSSNHRPAALLADAGQADASTTGFKPLTLGTPVAVTGGTLYWLAVSDQGTTPAQCRAIASVNPLVAVDSGVISGGVAGYRINLAAGSALPASWGSNFTPAIVATPHVRVRGA